MSTWLQIPVTVKIRLLDDEKDTMYLCSLLQSAGASVLAVHGRTRLSLKDRIEGADMEAVARIKKVSHAKQPRTKPPCIPHSFTLIDTHLPHF